MLSLSWSRTVLLEQLLQIPLLEAVGLVAGLLCVVLLVFQNIGTWPAGVVYALASVLLFYQTQLYAQLALHVLYCGMNVYGWYYWLAGKRPDEDALPVRLIPTSKALVVGALVAVGTPALGYALTIHGNATLPYWDSLIASASCAAIWMQAHKYLESWYVWLAVDVMATAIFVSTDLYLYALLYGVYIGLALAGWFAWRRSMRATRLVPHPAGVAAPPPPE